MCRISPHRQSLHDLEDFPGHGSVSYRLGPNISPSRYSFPHPGTGFKSDR